MSAAVKQYLTCLAPMSTIVRGDFAPIAAEGDYAAHMPGSDMS